MRCAQCEIILHLHYLYLHFTAVCAEYHDRETGTDTAHFDWRILFTYFRNC